MDGIILVDKPAGWTSFDVVAKIRGQIRKETGLKKLKVGHTGTLDPLATGLMIVVVGSFCKRASEFSKLDKVYDVTMKLGENSTTGDGEGIKTKISGSRPTEEALRAVLGHFIGEIMQKPPIYSAIKVNGQRAYKLAREGKTVELTPRLVKIYDITDVEFTYPEVKFTTKVSSGTYIRSLVEDIGKELGTGAYMSALNRTEVGTYNLWAASSIETLTDHGIS